MVAEGIAVIDCVEALPGIPRRWFLVENAPGELSWSLSADEATRFSVERAENLYPGRNGFPWLPTNPEKPPILMRVHYGPPGDAVPELPKAQPDPQIVKERVVKREARVASLKASIRHVDPHEAYLETARRLGEHVEEEA